MYVTKLILVCMMEKLPTCVVMSGKRWTSDFHTTDSSPPVAKDIYVMCSWLMAQIRFSTSVAIDLFM